MVTPKGLLKRDDQATKERRSEMSFRLSLIAAKAENGVIGNGPDIPWKARGEQLLFKAMTFNKWLIVGRKTFDAMGVLPNRKYVVLSKTDRQVDSENVRFFQSTDSALDFLESQTDHAVVSGGGKIYQDLIGSVDSIHVSTIHCEAEGDIIFPPIPDFFVPIFSQGFESNINYTYEIWAKKATG